MARLLTLVQNYIILFFGRYLHANSKFLLVGGMFYERNRKKILIGSDIE